MDGGHSSCCHGHVKLCTYPSLWVAMITFDCGPQFTSVEWGALCEIFDIAHRQTTAYHPEVNNAVGRLHCRVKDAINARAAAVTWDGSSLGLSLASFHNPKRTLVFPLPKQSMVPLLFCLMSFCRGGIFCWSNCKEICKNHTYSCFPSA